MTKKSAKQLQVVAKPGETEEQARIRALVSPTVQAASTMLDFLPVKDILDINELTAELTRQSKAIHSGDLTRAEEMLTAQAHALDGIFHNLATRAIRAEYLSQFETYLKLSLRAQSQSRATWETVSAIQNPPIARFIQQANIAENQQVNNESSRTREIKKAPIQLLEQIDDNRLDTGAPSKTSQTDTSVAAMAEIDRPTGAGG